MLAMPLSLPLLVAQRMNYFTGHYRVNPAGYIQFKSGSECNGAASPPMHGQPARERDFSREAATCKSMKTAAARLCEQGLHGTPCLLCHRVIVKRACVGGCAVQEHHDDAGEPFRLSACEAVAQDLFEEP